MPWKESCSMTERMEFIVDYLRYPEMSMSDLCRDYGISRKTGYKWVHRHLSHPEEGLSDRSHAPHRCPWAIDAETAEEIICLRRRYPFWGPRKLRAYLLRFDPDRCWPAASTIGDLLRREGLVIRSRCRRPPIPLESPFPAIEAPNSVWCTDFKGPFTLASGKRCDPLTVSDGFSRYLLEGRLMRPVGEEVRKSFDHLFRTYGLPLAIRSDNGPPFASTAAGGLSRLSVWWVKLGISLQRINPGHPEQNGRHERMHRTMKQAVSTSKAAHVAELQERLDHFREEYNTQRPHEALGQDIPAAHYHPSPRPYPEHVAEPVYSEDHAVRRVRSNGEIKWGGDFIFISESLIGEPVGVAETVDGDWIVRFCDVDLGLIWRRSKKFQRFTAARPGCRKPRSQYKTPT